MNPLEKFRGKDTVSIVRAALNRTPFHLIRVAYFQRFELNGYPRAAQRQVESMSTRPADARDLEGLVRCLDKRSTYERRFEAGEHCVVAIADEAVVGYEWFSAKGLLFEERYHYPITIPGDALYAYDAFTSEAFRGRGVWSQILVAATELMRNERRSRLISHIDYGNETSMVAHTKVGFRPAGWYLFVNVCGLRVLKRLRSVHRS